MLPELDWDEDEERTLVTELLLLCREAIKPSLKAYEPDGGFAEGPAYWNSATAYTAYYVAAIESASIRPSQLRSRPIAVISRWVR